MAESTEAMVAQAEPETQLCLKCGVPVSEDDGKVKGAGVTCTSCQNVYQMLYRHLGGYPATLATMAPDDQQKFFRSSNQVLRCAPKNGRWSVLRANLVTEMTRFKTEQVTNTVTQKYLPLSVWQTKGFDVDKIQAAGMKRDDEVFGEVWTAPLLTIKHDDIRGSIEKEVASKEYTLKEKKKLTPKAKAKAGALPEKQGNAEIKIDEDCWSVPSSDEAPKIKESKAAKSSKGDDAASAARKAAKEARDKENSWKKEIGKAAKNIATLNSLCNSLTTTAAKCKKQGGFEDDTIKGLEEALSVLQIYKNSATVLISTTEDVKEANQAPVFDEEDLQTKIKAAQDLLKDVRQVFSDRAAAKKAAQPPKADPKRKVKAKAKAAA